MTRSRTALVAVTGTVALLLTACGGGGGEQTGSGSGPSDEPLPLDAYMEQIYGDGSEEQQVASAREVEEIVASCMAEQGFEYIPADVDNQFVAGEELEHEWGTKEFAEEFGYGATTDPWGGEQAPEQEYVDPNQDYVEAMSPEEQEAYWAALWGEPIMSEDPEAEVEYDWTTSGCQGRAQHEVYETVEGVDEDEFAALQKDMEELWTGLQDDPRLVEANSEWASCMADAGYSGFATPEDAQNSIHEKANAVWEDAYADVDYSEATTDEEFAAIDEAIQEATDAKLAEITGEEIETAVADFDCQEKSGLLEVQDTVNRERQQEFIDTHKDLLDAWVASVQAGS